MKLIDGVEQAFAHVGTFRIPSVADRESLRVGDFAKIGWDDEEGGERVWYRVVRVTKGPRYLGEIASAPIVLRLRTRSKFERRHVLGVQRAGSGGQSPR